MNSVDKTETFLSLINTNKGILYKIVNSYCKNAEDRKDLIQEIIIQLWKSFDNYKEQYRYSTWMYRIALNVSISFYRKTTRRKEVSYDLIENNIMIEDSNSSIEKESDYSVLQRLIAELRDLDKALMLLYLEEKSYKEIAEIIGISETNVATKIGRIKTVLNQKISTLKN